MIDANYLNTINTTSCVSEGKKRLGIFFQKVRKDKKVALPTLKKILGHFTDFSLI